MSLINQMLKDLEKRSQSKLNLDATLVELYSSSKKNRIKINWEFIIFFTMVILFSFVIIKMIFPFKFSHKRNHLVSTSFNYNFKHGSAKSVENVSPAILTGLTFQLQDNKTSLIFLLSQDTLYRINSDIKNNSLVLFLDHAHFLSSLPPINYSNSGIRNIEMMNLPNGDLKIIIKLNDGIELSKMELNKSSKASTLQLELISGPIILNAIKI